MSIETRSSSALFKRAEQLRRWEESETNREPVSPKEKSRKIKFSSGCVFLAACAAGDKDEVLKLLEHGADINTANVDGLTALHQACIDDNADMVEFLVECGADVNRGDNEGWTPLHATASCGFLYTAKYLLEKGADVAAVNNDGELAIDIAECQKMEDLLKEEIDKKGIDCEAARNEEERLMLKDAKEWFTTKSSLVDRPHPKNGATALHVAAAKGYSDVMKVLFQCGAELDAQDADGWTPLHAAAHWGQKEASTLLAENLADMDAKNFVGQTPFDLADPEMFRYLEDLKTKQNVHDVQKRKAKKRVEKEDAPSEAETPSKVKKVEVEIADKQEDQIINNIEKKNIRNSLTINDALTINTDTEKLSSPTEHKRFSEHITEDGLPPLWKKPPTRQSKPEAESPVNSTGNINNDLNIDVTLRRQTSLPQKEHDKSKSETTNIRSSAPTSLSPVSSSQPLRRSFVPPVRDEESETQRKAHAKRVRETRRSTQGVTLEEIRSAEQLVKQKNSNDTSDSTNGIIVTATITTGTPTVITTRVEGNADETTQTSATTHERRPSWRLRVDNGCKFKLEDATQPSEAPSTPTIVRRTSTPSSPVQRPSSAPVEIAADATITIPFRRPKSIEEKDQDKENDVRNAQANLTTHTAIQRRRRTKRRSTGVVSFDNVEDADQEKDSGGGGDCENSTKPESGADRSSRSRISSSSDIRNENGEIDYKKLYEQQLVENDRLKDKLRKSDEELRDTKQTLEKINLVTSKNSLSELEKRERRAMERKLSEMEEELKQLQKLKAENERLKADNRSLTRVLNKLTNSAKK